MFVKIFDAGQAEVIERIKEYAQTREGQASPARWKKFTTRKNYLRFVCHEMIGELLAKEKQRLADTE